MAGLWTWGIDYKNQPLIDAWWTPGWTAQNDAYLQVPAIGVSVGGFPSNLTYVTVIGNFFDTQADPLSGNFTFMPSANLTFNVNGQITYIPRRYSGLNQTLLGVNQMGDGKIYLQYGRLSVSLLATNNLNMTPASFTYHVMENFRGGSQYDIAVPASLASTATDIHSLIIPGTIRPVTDSLDPSENNISTVNIPVISTQYVVADISATVAGSSSINLPQYRVNFAFISGASEPQSSDWLEGSWATNATPFIAQVLVGPSGHVLPVGTYTVWIQILASPQIPVFSVGQVNIF